MENKLSEIKGEVSELHPLLEKLFSRIPKIQKSEYTHGPSERGADFVLQVAHDVLGTTDYIGVVAKVGKILSDHADVERQIAECRLPRPIDGGKRKVRLNQVWVLTTATISNEAKERIFDKHEASNVQFIDGQRLAKLIDEFYPEYWKDIDIHVGTFLSCVRERVIALDKKYSLITSGEDVYVDQEIAKIPDDAYEAGTKGKSKPKKKQMVNIRNEIEENRFVIIEGAMGSGKSKLLRRLAVDFASPERFMEDRVIPVYVAFKEFAEKHDSSVEKTINDVVPEETRKSAGSDQKYMVLVDGIDEKKLSIEDHIALLDKMRDEVNKRHNIRLVATSRSMRGIDGPQKSLRALERYEIQPLSMKKTIEFLLKICAHFNVRTRMLEDLKRSPLFKELPKSPIAAILLAELLHEGSQDLPSNMTELYQKYVELMLGRWDIRKGLQSQKEYEAMASIISAVSRHMIDNEVPYISESELMDRINTYLKQRNLNLNSDELFHQITQRSEILVAHEGDGLISFKHRSFSEFMYARSLMQESTHSIDRRAFQVYWMNIFYFMVGLKKDAPEFLNSLVDLVPTTEGERWVKLVNMPNYMLAAYSTPYEVITRAVEQSMLEASQLYLDISEAKVKSQFSGFSRMHLLYMVQLLIRNGYSYEFLKPALEDSAVSMASVLDQDSSDNKIAFAMFFLNVAYSDVGEEKNFQFMFDYVKNMPQEVAFGILHETVGLPQAKRSAALKKHEKRMRTSLSKDAIYRKSVINQLYHTPAHAKSIRNLTTNLKETSVSSSKKP